MNDEIKKGNTNGAPRGTSSESKSSHYFETMEGLRLQVKKLNRHISLQEKRILRSEAVMTTREKFTDMLRAERLVQEDCIKQARSELAEKNELIRIMLENAPVGLTIFDKDFNFIDCNEAVLKIYGVTKEFYREF